MAKNQKGTKNAKSNILYSQNVDFPRLQMAKKHNDNNASIITGRECLHNALGYGAKNILLFNFLMDNERYFAVAHDGTPFKDSNDLKDGFIFNKSGGRGVQGSGGKMSMFCTVDDISNAEYAIMCKTQNSGELVYALTPDSKNKTKLNVTDQTSKFLPYLQRLLNKGKKFNQDKYNDVYKLYNVIYIYRYNISTVDTSKTSITSYCDMNAMMDVSRQILNETQNGNLNVHYLHNTKFGNGAGNGKGLTTKHKIRIKSPYMKDDFMIKKFTTLFKNNEYTEESGNVLNFDLELTLKVYPNIRYTDKGNFEGYLSWLNYQTTSKPYYNNETVTNIYDYCKHGILIFQDIPLDKTKNTKRANEEPSFWQSQRSAWHFFDDLGIRKPGMTGPWDANVKRIAEYLRNDKKAINNIGFENVETWEPSVVMEVRIISKDNPHSFGSYDNCFYSFNPDLTKKIVKGVLRENADKENTVIQQYNNYISDFIPKSEKPKLLGYKEKKSKNTPRIKAIVLNTPNNRNVGGVSKSHKGELKTLPVGMSSPLEVELIGTDGNTIILDDKDDIRFNHKGIKIKKSIQGNFDILVDDYFHYDVNDIGQNNKISHTKEQHKIDVNYFPRKKNKLYINGHVFEISFDVEVQLNKSKHVHNGKRKDTKNKTRIKEEQDIYFNGDQGEKLLVKWDGTKNIPKLNSNMQAIKSFAENKEDQSDRFSEVYEKISEIGRNVYLNKKFDNYYNFHYKGNQNFDADFGGGNGFRFNERVKDYLAESIIVKKLRDAHKKYMESNAYEGTEGEHTSGNKPKALQAKENSSDSTTGHKSVSKVKKAFGSK